MSIHPSLSSSSKDKKSRSVLKRTERLKIMLEKDKWKEGDDVYGLPKIKTVRLKIKKEKAAEKPTEAVAPGGTVPEGAAPAAGETKEQAAPKGPTTKAQEKK